MLSNFSLWRTLEDFVLPSFSSILTPVMGKWHCWVIEFLVFLLRELFSHHYFLTPSVCTLEKCTILLSFLCYPEISRQNKCFLVLNSLPWTLCNGLILLTECLSCSVLGRAAPLSCGSLFSYGLSLERNSFVLYKRRAASYSIRGSPVWSRWAILPIRWIVATQKMKVSQRKPVTKYIITQVRGCDILGKDIQNKAKRLHKKAEVLFHTAWSKHTQQVVLEGDLVLMRILEQIIYTKR